MLLLCRGRARSHFSALARASSRYGSSQGDPDFGAGLFGFAELARGPCGFNALVSRVGERVNALRARVLDADARGEHGLPVLCTMDAISDEVCTVIDAAELCRNVHHCAVHRDAANNCVLRISSLIHELNTDVALHQTLCRTDAFMRNSTRDADVGTFTAEQLRMAKLLLEDFERDGIHLSAGGRARVRELQSEIDELGARFTRGIGDPSCTRSVQISAAELASLPPGVQPRLRPKRAYGGGGGGSGDGAFEDELTAASDSQWLAADVATTQYMLRYCPSASLRRKVFLAGTTSAASNLEVLDALVAARHDLAQPRSDRRRHRGGQTVRQTCLLSRGFTA